MHNRLKSILSMGLTYFELWYLC